MSPCPKAVKPNKSFTGDEEFRVFYSVKVWGQKNDIIAMFLARLKWHKYITMYQMEMRAGRRESRKTI